MGKFTFMLPDFRVILAAMFVTAIFVTLIGAAVTRVPNEAPTPGSSQVSRALWQQKAAESQGRQHFQMLGYARRASERNRLLEPSQPPAPMKADASGDKSSGAIMAVAPSAPGNSDGNAGDSQVRAPDITGSVKAGPVDPSTEAPAAIGITHDTPSNSPEAEALVVAGRPGTNATDAVAHPALATMTILPTARPKQAQGPSRLRLRIGHAINLGSVAPAPSLSGDPHNASTAGADRVVGTSEPAVTPPLATRGIAPAPAAARR
jgi:hypothetical protein